MPLAAEIGKAYATYYTHASQDIPANTTWRTKLRRSMESAYWSKHFGYRNVPLPVLAKIIGPLYYLSSTHQREAEATIRGLSAIPNGRLFDVGCGSGDWLLLMRGLGWEVAGNDFDANAIRVATQRDLQVNLGSLEEQNLPDNSFDAITLSHVIEHVPNPLATMRECFRILKPGGKIVLLTPNCASLSQQYFKEDWRGLEPPRHLHIFSLNSMDRLLALAGFEHRFVRPFIVTSVIYESLQLRWGRTNANLPPKHPWLARGLTHLFKFAEACVIRLRPSVGDCVFAVAVKK